MSMALLLAAAVAFSAARLIRDYPSSLPDVLLVRITPVDPLPGEVLRPELARRWASRQISEQVFSVYAQRLLRHLARSELLIRTRNQWPAEVPMRIQTVSNKALVVLVPFRIRVTLTNGSRLVDRVVGIEDIVACDPGAPITWEDPTIPVSMADGLPELSLRVGISSLANDLVLAEELVLLHVPMVADNGSLLEIEQCDLKDLLKVWSQRYRDKVVVYFRSDLADATCRIGVGGRVELWSDDSLAATREWWHDWTSGDITTGIALPCIHKSNQYVVKIVSDPIIALRDFEATRYWKGVASFPVVEDEH